VPVIALLLAFRTVMDEQCSMFISEGNNLFIAPSAGRFWGPFGVCPLTTGVSFPGGKVGLNVRLIVPLQPLLGFGIQHVRPCALRAKRLVLLGIVTQTEAGGICASSLKMAVLNGRRRF
jgi:hypothetical protein